MKQYTIKPDNVKYRPNYEINIAYRLEKISLQQTELCGDIYCCSYTYCRQRQFMQVHSADIVAIKHILSLVTIDTDIDAFYQANGQTICALNFDTNCRQRQNMPSTLKQIVAENSTDLAVKY